MVDAIDSGSTNGHRLIISPDGQRLYTENEEDGTVSVIDLPKRKLLGKIKTPRPLAGIAISADGRTVVAVDDAEPTLFLIDTAGGQRRATRCGSKDVPKAAQIARYAPGQQPDRRHQPEQRHGQPDRPVVSRSRPRSRSAASRWTWRSAATNCSSPARATARCTSIDIPARRAKQSFQAGKGCKSLGFF